MNTESIVCKRCGKKNTYETTLCIECGYELSAVKIIDSREENASTNKNTISNKYDKNKIGCVLIIVVAIAIYSISKFLGGDNPPTLYPDNTVGEYGLMEATLPARVPDNKVWMIAFLVTCDNKIRNVSGVMVDDPNCFTQNPLPLKVNGKEQLVRGEDVKNDFNGKTIEELRNANITVFQGGTTFATGYTVKKLIVCQFVEL